MLLWKPGLTIFADLKMVSMLQVLRVIMDDKYLSLFEKIALSSANTDIMINRLRLTKQQYYPRIYDLRKAGLIRKSNTKVSSYPLWESSLQSLTTNRIGCQPSDLPSLLLFG
jgi:hypothetical protein